MLISARGGREEREDRRLQMSYLKLLNAEGKDGAWVWGNANNSAALRSTALMKPQHSRTGFNDSRHRISHDLQRKVSPKANKLNIQRSSISARGHKDGSTAIKAEEKILIPLESQSLPKLISNPAAIIGGELQR